MHRKFCVGKGNLARALAGFHFSGDCHKVARVLANDLHFKHPVTGPPFAPEHFAQALGIEVLNANIEAEGVLTNYAALRRLMEEEQEDVIDPARQPEGVFIPDSETGPQILLRTIRPGERVCAVRRRNFTLAHEIGHYVIRKALAPTLVEFNRDDPEEEALCNVFASELLMPSFSLCPDLMKYGISPHALLCLRDRYAVSLQGLLCRVTGIFRSAVVAILWAQKDGRPPTISWAGPTQFRRVVLSDTGHMSIENAFHTSKPVVGRCDVLLDGQRSRWYTVALRLPDSNKVVSVLHRCMKEMDRYLHIRPRLVFHEASCERKYSRIEGYS
jgi:IrrE N-terminal-like domain